MLKKLLLCRSIDINKILLTNYIKLGINEVELVMLMHLFSLFEKNKTVLSFNGIKNKMTISANEVSTTLNSLIGKGFLEINSEFSKNGREQECFDLTPTLVLIDRLFIEEEQDLKEINSNESISELVRTFEHELARSMSPIEISIISNMVNTYDVKSINEAIIEAVKNGKISLKYVEAILKNGKEENVEINPTQARAIDEFYSKINR